MARIVEPNLDILLFNRLKKPLDAEMPLLDKLREMHNFLVQAVRPESRSDGQELLAKLCRAVSIYIGQMSLFLYLSRVQPRYYDRTKPMAYLRAPLDLQQKIVAAMAIGDHDLVRNLLPENLKSPEWRSLIFGSPLSFAICQGDANVVRTVLQCMSQYGAHGMNLLEVLIDDYYGESWSKTSAMAYAITCRRPKVLDVIKEFQERFGKPLSRKAYNTLLTLAICSGEVDLVRVVFRLKVNGGVRITLNHITEAAQSRNEDVMLAIITSPGMSVNKAYSDTSPLLAAVRTGDVHMVRAVLKAGAEIDMKVGGRTALVEAMTAGKDVIFQTLLDHGAQLPPRAVWPQVPRKQNSKQKGVREVLENEQRRRSRR